MDTNEPQSKSESNSGLMVHQVLAVSYAVYLVSILIGFVLDVVWPVRFLSSYVAPAGFVLILLGSLLAFWAQYVSGAGSHFRNTQKDSLSHNNFLVGPYNWTRSPTQYALVLLTLGLAMIYNSVIMVVMTAIAFVLGKFVFIPLEEKHLAQKYGQSYEEYKKKVRF